LAGIGAELKQLGAGKVLIVTDQGLVAAGLAQRLGDLLDEAELSWSRYDKVEPDPRYETAAEVVEAAQGFGAEVLVGLGGGSAIDICKVSSVLLTNPGPIDKYFGVDMVPAPGLPTIAIPTTAGTGSEVTPIAILSDEKEKLKTGVVSRYLFPNVAFLDPELTLGLPPNVTAATGLDALIHALEAYTSKNATPRTDLLARRAMELLHGNIRTAFCDGTNLPAREAMLEGSMLAGMAFANAGVTAVHAFAYPIGAQYHIPHGVANSIMLGPVMEFNLLGNLNKFADMARILGQPTKGMSYREAALRVVDALHTLAEDLRVPCHLGSFGVTEQDLPLLAEGVMKVTRLLANNPRVLTQEDAEAIYRRAL